jgi:hypothetical protein
MKVSELIKQLNDLGIDSRVVFQDQNGGCWDVLRFDVGYMKNGQELDPNEESIDGVAHCVIVRTG